VEYRPLEGFVYAITPFNFAAIGANLPSAPALMGNVVLWKPSSTAILSNYLMYKVLEEAGLPAGVINFLPSRTGIPVSNVALQHRAFSGLHFTGSTATFKSLWASITTNLNNYRSFPRIVGETGGKNFHFIHESADLNNAINQTIRAAFEYSGQKCSACSRVYLPQSLANQFQSGLVKATQDIISSQYGDQTQFSTFVGPVIDDKSFQRITQALEQVKKDSNKAKIIVGGRADKSKGYFIEPTVIVTTDPHYFTMKEELFGPVLTIYTYDNSKYLETLQLCDATAEYALTGKTLLDQSLQTSTNLDKTQSN
jgi:1-pyrroline-5-carboxylate dehydrogenase